MKKIKIVHIISGLKAGGAEMMLLKVLERLDAGFVPHVISLSTLGDMGPRIQALGVHVEVLGMQPGRIPRPVELLRLIRRLKALSPDVVHTWMYHADLVGGLAAKIAGVSAVAWAIHHSNLSSTANKRSTLAVVRACSLLSRWVPKKILCCSEATRRTHVDFSYQADKMVVVPNGFDVSRFKSDESSRPQIYAELGLGKHILLVGLIGRFDPQKNHTGFFEAAEMLHQRLPNVHFVLAGQDIDENNDELLHAVEKSGTGAVTHLLGQRNDIPILMASLNVLVSSSIGEAFPNVLGEAMACGVPCVVTDVGDCAAIVGETGHVVQSGDMVGLADAMEKLLMLPSVKRADLGARARRRVEENFELGQVVKRYERFYLDLLS